MKNSEKSSTDKSDLCTNLHSAQYNGEDKATNLVISTQNELNALYQSVGRDEIPTVDFSKSQVIALFLGSRTTGGYSISVDRVEEEDGKLIIYKKLEKIDPDKRVTQRIEKFNKMGFWEE